MTAATTKASALAQLDQLSINTIRFLSVDADRFGASAPREVMMREYGFTVENICERALDLVKRKCEVK